MIPPGILTTLFVDNLSLSFSASTMALAERRIQLGINNVVKWADTNGFKFSYNKTGVIHFCKIRKFYLDPDLYLKNHRIPCVEETRFLGLIFDKKLTWVPHLKAINLLSVTPGVRGRFRTVTTSGRLGRFSSITFFSFFFLAVITDDSFYAIICFFLRFDYVLVVNC